MLDESSSVKAVHNGDAGVAKWYSDGEYLLE